MMSSIAYITDQDMIEYHRLHGNNRIVYWRPSGQKKFQFFQHGDYLFFLTKGTEKGKQREKGIIGYGRYEQDERCGIHEMWEKYGVQCGYADETRLQNAIMKMNKNHKLPQQIQCLILNNIIFFQTPIYLSELDKTISKQIESYIYLDQELSWNILAQAQQAGIDYWTRYVEQHDHPIQHDQDIIIVQNLREQLTVQELSKYEKKKTIAFAKTMVIQKHGRYLAGATMDFACWKNNVSCFYLPCLLSLKTWKRNLLYTIAKAVIYQAACKEKDSAAVIKILFDESNKAAEVLCHYAAIDYEIKQ